MASFLKQPKVKIAAAMPALSLKAPKIKAPPLQIATPLTLGGVMGGSKPAKKKKAVL